MKSRALKLSGAWEITAEVHSDDRGAFFEAFSIAKLSEISGLLFDVAQVNISTSRHGTIRGIHYSDVPPGQAKYVQCVDGEILDVLIDLRTGSATFGQFECVRLSSEKSNSVLVPVGFGHAFQALSDSARVMYCCSSLYSPANEHALNPLDPAIGINWEPIEPVLSPKDAAAPTLAELAQKHQLPSLAMCLEAEELWRP